ncbi:hypothetical protein G6O67_002604 [Ophiocordyceps sinensis]|uniref:Uncharacterized protein n=1 Tax=Ophiocordyceps sinensis TaxID=72228 RepID=A0A8H4PUR9_9HYPO|nr:hypothetical protein G6O67_002604 [Ophiocordyceps sinensis]
MMMQTASKFQYRGPSVSTGAVVIPSSPCTSSARLQRQNPPVKWRRATDELARKIVLSVRDRDKLRQMTATSSWRQATDGMEESKPEEPAKTDARAEAQPRRK